MNRATQLNTLLLNLITIQALAMSNTDEPVTHHLIQESQFFIEWIVPTLNLDTDLVLATELVELQRQLSAWQLHWSDLWQNSTDRQTISQQIHQWCDRLQPHSVPEVV